MYVKLTEISSSELLLKSHVDYDIQHRLVSVLAYVVK